jgi:hypothetical protein
MMTSRHSSSSDDAGQIHLRQSAEVTMQGQRRTFEIAITLPAGAGSEAIAQALQQAEAGMQGLTERMNHEIEAAQVGASPAMIEAEHAPESAVAQIPERIAAPAAATPDAETAGLTAFLRAARDLGFDVLTASKALGVSSLQGIDYAAALRQLQALRPPVPRAFAEEIGPQDAAASQTVPDDGPDDPDFGPIDEEDLDPETATPGAPTPDAALQKRDAAMRLLRELRGMRSGGPVATPELRQSLKNCVIAPLGQERTQELIVAVWHLAAGEKLNAARTRRLIEWSKDDDDFEETAALVIDLARQPAPAGE